MPMKIDFCLDLHWLSFGVCGSYDPAFKYEGLRLLGAWEVRLITSRAYLLLPRLLGKFEQCRDAQTRMP